ncbi:MAG TPA: NAD(P)-binding domain-containing protein [Xanthobacteraceae bacterium]|jgi:cation diffusion facilitator CzcD-associated flavoprotein CzcO|nr:NAD(P)-binding domain-containing protein [Xanthobacteraceae bacterium]
MRSEGLGVAEAPAAADVGAPVAERVRPVARCDVAVIGAGPYGLAAAAHLRAAGFATRVFGHSMAFWRRNMPKGMKLRHATGISDPHDAFSLEAFARIDPAAAIRPLPIETFIAYAEWFQQHAVPHLDRRKVARVEPAAGGFALRLEGGDMVEAGRVVVALGLKNQDFRPAQFIGLPERLVSHSCEHADFAHFRGRRVAVIGRGQSACESAVLLHEAGAEVDLLTRGPIHWIGAETGDHGAASLKWRLHDLMSPHFTIGPFPLSWLVMMPALLHAFPPSLRGYVGARCLRAAATAWLRPRWGDVRLSTVRSVRDAQPAGDGVSLRLDSGATLDLDHVLLATGYQVDIAKYRMLAPELLHRVDCVDGSPVLSAGFESSVPGLHFVGSSAVLSFGPLMRFVAGTGYAAHALTRAVVAAGR